MNEDPRFHVDKEFRNLIRPLTEDEYKRLEADILAKGIVRDPLCVWKGILLDGHNRWKIIQEHWDLLKDGYDVADIDCEDRAAALAWVCSNQLGRRNLSDHDREMLLGTEYKYKKESKGGNDRERNENGTFTHSPQNGDYGKNNTSSKTARKIAEEHGVSKNTVERAEHYVDGLNAAESVEPGFTDMVASGEIKATKTAIRELRKLEDDDLREAVQAMKDGDKEAVKEIISKSKNGKSEVTESEPEQIDEPEPMEDENELDETETEPEIEVAHIVNLKDIEMVFKSNAAIVLDDIRDNLAENRDCQNYDDLEQKYKDMAAWLYQAMLKMIEYGE